jgi:quinol-cytochrome oxidoreductase complex cytochrome b subunit
VLILPWVLLFMIAVHVYLVHRHGLRKGDE